MSDKSAFCAEKRPASGDDRRRNASGNTKVSEHGGSDQTPATADPVSRSVRRKEEQAPQKRDRMSEQEPVTSNKDSSRKETADARKKMVAKKGSKQHRKESNSAEELQECKEKEHCSKADAKQDKATKRPKISHTTDSR